MAQLECRNIHKSFGSIVALRDVSMAVEAGEARALFGGNGSGKSTLAKIIGGFVKASEGELFINGELASYSAPGAAKRAGVVITAQELSLLSNLSVAQNLTLCAIPTKMGTVDRRALRRMAAEALEQVHLSEVIDLPVDELSLNQKYMVEFAKALVQKPKILILDEITSALYREEVLIVKERIDELKRGGCTVIFVSHRMPEIYAVCDTVTVLRNGGVVGTYPVAEKSKNELLSLMTGRTITDVEQVETQPQDVERKTVLEVRDLKLLSKDTTVDLTVHEGEIIGVAGLQGNGQSELVRALFAADRPIDVTLCGTPCRLKNPSGAVRRGVAFISGERELEGTFPSRSIAENVGAITDLVLGRKAERERQREMLEAYHVVMSSPRQQIQTLSGGNQQKVVMARWTMMSPKLILADDPTKGIDVNARRDVHSLLKELTKAGTAVIFVSSDDEELVELTRSVPFSRVIVMYDGGIVNTLVGSSITTEQIAASVIPGERSREEYG